MDNEKFLKNPAKYEASKLQVVNFPTNSGDLSPIETVWAWHRKDLAKRELQDLEDNKVITAAQLKQHCQTP